MDSHSVHSTLISPMSLSPAICDQVPSSSIAFEDLLEQYYPLVYSVVQRMLPRLPQCADVDELCSVGLTGLVAAVRNYRSEQAATFKSYAMLRIRGAVLDELRKMDLLPRGSRMKWKRLQQVVGDLEQRLGRVPGQTEIAREMGLTELQLEDYQRKARPVRIFSLDQDPVSEEGDLNLHDSIPDETVKPSYAGMEERELVDRVRVCVRALPERQQRVIDLYYYGGKRLAEIAEIFGVTEARICQIHSQALESLRRDCVYN